VLPQTVLDKLDRCLDRIEPLLPPASAGIDWRVTPAAWWRHGPLSGSLAGIPVLPPVSLDDVLGIDRQKSLVVGNTRQFVQGLPANNVLLTGARGAGKSSLVQALLHQFYADGLRVIQVEAPDLRDLPAITAVLPGGPWRYVLFCDDLSFDARDEGYKALKSILDGALQSTPDNVLIYATSNRRHLMPEYATDNDSYRHDEKGELHPGEAVEEKISLSDRFGLWVSFQPMGQDQYLAIARHWVARFGDAHGVTWCEPARQACLRWSLQRGTRSGRTAYQFARSWVGNALLQNA
jgi:predicted AAA+ superfamily ATPase